MNEKESVEHIEMFVRNKIREGYKGLFPKRSAKRNVLSKWNIYKDKGANLEAVSILGENRINELILQTIESILNSKEQLQRVLNGEYIGSAEDLINGIWED